MAGVSLGKAIGKSEKMSTIESNPEREPPPVTDKQVTVPTVDTTAPTSDKSSRKPAGSFVGPG